jgi:hypothetical protein
MAKKNKKEVEKHTAQQRAAAVEKMMETPEGRLLMERMAVLWEEVEQAGDAAKHGEILDDMETALMSGGRELLRKFMESAVAKKVAKIEGEESRICGKADADGKPCGGDLRHRGSKKKR